MLKTLTFLLVIVAVAVVVRMVPDGNPFKKVYKTGRALFGDSHARSFLLFALVVVVLIVIGAGVTKEGLTIKDILLIP